MRKLTSHHKRKVGFILPTKIEDYKDSLTKLASEINNGFLIELPDLNKSAGIIKDDTHPNEKGHKIIAETVATYLEDNNLIPCN